MRKIRPIVCAVVVAGLTLAVSSCYKQPDQSILQPASDPAQANLASISQPLPNAQSMPNTVRQPTATSRRVSSPQAAAPAEPSYQPSNAEPVTQSQAYTQPQPNYEQPDPSNASYSSASYDYPEDNGSGEPPIEADQPPPPLPAYQQPECPGDNYL